MDEHSRGFGELRDAVRQVDGRIVALDGKLDRLLTRLETDVDQCFTRLDDKMSRQFFWILGVQIAVLVAVISALVSA